MRIIALSGWRGSGKDMVALHLEQECGFHRMSFAGLLKDMVANDYELERVWLDDRELKEAALLQYPVEPKDAFTAAIAGLLDKEFAHVNGSRYWTPRAICILEGSVKRSVNPNFWVDYVAQKMIPGQHYVISDVRYKNELHRLQEKFPGKVTSVRIERFDTIASTDPSERDLDDEQFDYVIDNRGKTIQEVFDQVKVIYEEIVR